LEATIPALPWQVRLMRYRLEISRKAREQLRALPKEHRRNIRWRMEEMREDLRGDVLKLQAKGNYYRLRFGNFRVLFLLAGDAIKVYAVKDRKDAYE
jgi:mRNA-degrading endonuclease RelE of RelBE toxin-antitoxin system